MAKTYWEKVHGVKPLRVSDEDVLRTAHLFIKKHGDRAAMEAAMRSNAALEVADEYNYELWLRITMAIQEFQRRAALGPKGLN